MDKFTATWVSHSSISDYLTCPRAYYLKNVYKDPQKNKKVQIMSPALALGQAVHNTLESLSVLKVEERFRKPLPERFEENWQKISGKRGGFTDEKIENRYKKRGRDMIARVFNHPGPLAELAVKINADLPYFWLSETDEIILCGKIDWLEYLKDKDAVRIIDFKTGKYRESEGSLQLPIYHLLVNRCQKRKVVGAAYWYLETDDVLTEKELPDLDKAEKQILDIARKIKLARQLKKFECPNGTESCNSCIPFERVLNGEGEFVGNDDFGALVYVLPPKEQVKTETESVVL
jgi:ATP-dependent helicase/DNAse subunit B